MSVHLVIGASGQVGDHLLREGKRQGLHITGTSHAHALPLLLHLDIRNPEEVQNVLGDVRPSVVYLPASFVNVDACELRRKETFMTNVEGVLHVVRAVNAIGATLVYFSSDYIFDGAAGPYKEDDAPNPLSEYGRQKLIAEHAIALHASRPYLIVRTTVVYSWEKQGKNFIMRLLRSLEAGETIRVSEDQLGNATYAPNLARAVLELVTRGAQGVFHVCGPERSSRYAFAVEAARTFGFDAQRITPVATKELQQIARRPLQAGMVTDRVAPRLSFPLMSYREGLRAMLEERVLAR